MIDKDQAGVSIQPRSLPNLKGKPQRQPADARTHLLNPEPGKNRASGVQGHASQRPSLKLSARRASGKPQNNGKHCEAGRNTPPVAHF